MKDINKIISIVGPTGIGKTRLAIQLAQKFNGEIVNTDSRQIYRYMNIGTAKPTKEELAIVPHHLIDIINPDEDFSLAAYQQLAYEAICDIQQRGKLPFLVGGSGLYVWAVVEGWVIPKVVPDNEYRRALEQKAEAGNAHELYQELVRLDPLSAERIDPHNVRRVIRALEVNKQATEPFSKLQKKQPPPFQTQIIGLTMDRKELYRRVDERVDGMLKCGFADEVKKLVEEGYNLTLPSMSSIGYRELGQYLQGEIKLEEAVYKIKVGTHRFIRHQYAWFRLKDERIRWWDIGVMDEREIENEVSEWVK
jgi:tRNA dimethylallyltransferase